MNFKEFKEKAKKIPFLQKDLAKLFSVKPQSMRNQLQRWKKKGLVISLKKGVYVLSPEERTIPVSKQLIAANLYAPSYVSLETALSYYKLIPEKNVALTSVTTRKTKTFQNKEGLFIYRHLMKKNYFGFQIIQDEYGFPYFIAEPEKALLDFLYLNLGSIQSEGDDFFTLSMRLQNRSLLDKKKLLLYAKRYSVKKLLKIIEQLK